MNGIKRFFSTRTKTKVAVVTIVAAALAVMGVGIANAATTPASHVRLGLDNNNTWHLCVNNTSGTVHTNHVQANWATNKCPSGYTQMHWNINQPGPVGPQGPKGVTGTTGATGPQGPQGPAGPAGSDGTNGTNGADGASAVLSVTGATTVTAWPESSGWADDAFSRTLTVTGQSTEVDNDACNGAAHCYLFTYTLNDNAGTFVTNGGKTGPNGTGTVSDAKNGTMSGTASGTFYADSAALANTGIPHSATGADKPASTSTWFHLAFPSGTHFFKEKLNTYRWAYTCGTQTWIDQINPGDDGQSAADGNITDCVAVS